MSEIDTPNVDIREVVESLLLKMDVPYSVTPYDQRLHDVCCRRAIEQGYPMGTDPAVPSLRPFIPSGVIMAATAYAHLENEATRVFIALYTAFVVFVDDVYQRDNGAVRVFMERFVRGEKQADPLLDGLAHILQELPDHFEPVVAGIILTATLNLVNASTLEFQTQGMEVSHHAEGYPGFSRQMSGSSETYALMAFPRHISVQNYIQCVPEATLYVAYGNDVLSFYKEEIAGDTVNYISVLARRQGVPNMTAFQELADEVGRSAAQVGKILEGDQEAHDAWQKFKAGYVGFHTSFQDRYRLNELMN
ncbi:hypothetical protein HYPSUDRAFT_205915 [Hypholoma sublateritium FD-334 SS-4]|uniref:Terpene synthase n=1 Tax=Hypholoma sublateritium (strain FD-334 SS-4) TaxID=945553 RepID=A0A0D2M3Q5_HYPSF|nr:hypothetical protein HYPSUDRAFT_205915 [Hypholoma sublateritium FD-334 SS-4]